MLPTLTDVTLPEGSGIPAVGTVVSVSNLGSPPVFNPIGNQGNITENMKVEQADTTNQGTRWKQSIPTLFDPGTEVMDIHFIPSSPGQDGNVGIVGHKFTGGGGSLGDMFLNQEIRTWQKEYPDGTIEQFQAYLLDFPVTSDVAKDLMLKLTLQRTGQPVFI
jgi:hypothetical protein